MAKIAILLKLVGNDFSISGGIGEIDQDQVGPKPMRRVNSKCGIVFFADRILSGACKSPAHRASDARLAINEKDFFQDLHGIASYSEHRLCQQLALRRSIARMGFLSRAVESQKTRYRINGERENYGVEAE